LASTALAHGSKTRPRSGAGVRTWRAASGSVLFAYVFTHLLNHALGLISLEALEGGRDAFLWLWRNPIGTILLYGSFLVHAGLAIRSLYRRRSLRMPAWQAMQLLLGLAIPPLLWEHVVGTRIAEAALGTRDGYPQVLAILWALQPAAGLRQVVTLVIAWLHGCIGLHYWLRLKGWYEPALPYIYAAALLIPVLALLGFGSAGRDVAELMADEGARARIVSGFPDQAGIARLTLIYNAGLAFYFTLLLGTLAARLARMAVERRHAVQVNYPDGRRIEIGRGATLLEASRAAGVPHASVCGGRGRCSTCRVRVVRGMDHLPPPSEDEQRVLQRVGAGAGTRLACQTRPTGPVEIVPLLPPHAGPADARGRPAYLHGAEQEIAILFCDLRSFTNLAEHRLPYDLVFLLNRFFRAMGEAVEEAGGRVDKFIGDGVMALFGIGATPAVGCRSALEAARRMAQHLSEINRSLAHDLPEPLRIGIGIHVGPAIIGEMGYGRATGLTAIGDAVNAASRLEALTKDFGCQLVVSQAVADLAGLPLEPHPTREVSLRGRRESISVRIVVDAASLPAAGSVAR
jgi:adenylate cyclase